MAEIKDNSLLEVFEEANCSGKDFIRALIREVVQRIMEAEIAHALGATPFSRQRARHNRRRR